MTIHSPHHLPVGIVGAGPVGLTASLLLSQLGVAHVLIDPNTSPTSHPQAHFISTRSMEILHTHLPHIHSQLVLGAAPSTHWRDFSYRYSVMGRELARVDQFSGKQVSADHWGSSPSNCAHIPQSRLEEVLRNSLPSAHCTTLFGYEVAGLSHKHTAASASSDTSSSPVLSVRRAHTPASPPLDIDCSYVIAADGANSLLRRLIGIRMIGDDCIQTLINVHFTCAIPLSRLTPRPAMIYFTFNENAVIVFVAHNLKKHEWVAQIPIFAPLQSASDVTPTELVRLLRHGLGLDSEGKGDKIEILSVRAWRMQARVAETLSGRGCFLLGDSAHGFPPAGGLGLNTGIADALNIAHKMKLVMGKAAAPSLLASYCHERRPVAIANCEKSVSNYGRTCDAAARLGVNPSHADMLLNAINASPLPLSLKKNLLKTGLKAGLASLAYLKSPHLLGDFRVRSLRDLVDEGGSLQLIFPGNDLDYVYGGSASDNPLAVGRRVPHVWFECGGGVISSVALPAATCRRSSGSRLFAVVLGEHVESSWRSALDSEAENLRGLVALVLVHKLSGADLVEHKTLQGKHQFPSYSDNDDKIPSENGQFLPEFSQRGELLLRDISGEWEGVSKGRAVFLRPDGHVLANEDELRPTFESIHRYLRKSGTNS